MIDVDHRRPDRGAMAVFADIRRLNMRRALTDRRRAVMAIYAVGRDIRVIENCR